MVVKDIFKDVEYPEDKKSIEHIIKEYDKVILSVIESSIKSDFSLSIIFYILNLLLVTYLFKSDHIPTIIKLICLTPALLQTVYDAYVRITTKIKKGIDNKAMLKLNLSFLMLVWFMLFLGILLLQSILFPKWTILEYALGLLILLSVSGVLCIITRKNMPKKFIQKYQYKNNKIFTMDKSLIILTQVLIAIVYINKPYIILLSLIYMLEPILLSMIINIKFTSNQYDKIEELKKQINYVPKK